MQNRARTRKLMKSSSQRTHTAKWSCHPQGGVELLRPPWALSALSLRQARMSSGVYTAMWVMHTRQKVGQLMSYAGSVYHSGRERGTHGD